MPAFRTTSPRFFAPAIIALLACALLVAACGDDDDDDDADPTESSDTPTEAAGDGTDDGDTNDDDDAMIALDANVTEGCVDSFDPNTDYFPDKADILDAENFSVEYHGNYKVVTVEEPSPGLDPVTYVLVQCGTDAPDMDADAVVEVPVTSFFSHSTTHLPWLDMLGHMDALTGVSDSSYISTQSALDRVENGDVLAYGFFEFDVEAVLEAEPEVLVTDGFGVDAFAVLEEAGVPIVHAAEWLEPTALGRAEWLKYGSLFFNEEAQANDLYLDIQTGYNDLAAEIADQVGDSDLPTVMTGDEFEGTWYVAGGQSYVARFIHDAGGDYLWADDNGTGSIELDFETVLDTAVDAEIWLNPPPAWVSLEGALEVDDRYDNFAAFQAGNVWNQNRATSETGANDFFETAVSRPDLVLADFVKIIHPELAQDHELQWYLQLPAN